MIALVFETSDVMPVLLEEAAVLRYATALPILGTVR